MGEKGSKAEWIDYFTLIHGRAPSAAEIEAARDIYESGAPEQDGAAEQSASAAAGSPSEQPPVAVERPDGDASDSDAVESVVAPAESAVTVDQEQAPVADESDSTMSSVPADAPSAADTHQPVSNVADPSAFDQDDEDGSEGISAEPPVVDQPEPQPDLTQSVSNGPIPDFSAATANSVPDAPAEPTAGQPRVVAAAAIAAPAGDDKPAAELRDFITEGQWKDKAGWQDLVQPEGKLPITVAVVNVLLGIFWLIVMGNISSILNNLHLLGMQLDALIQANSSAASAGTATSTIRTLLGGVTGNLSGYRAMCVVMAIVMIGFAANYLFKVVKINKPLHWLVGTDVVTMITAIGGYLAINGALNTVVVPENGYTVKDILDMASSMAAGTGSALNNSSGGIIGSLMSAFGGMVQHYAQYLVDVVNDLHTVQSISIALFVISGALAAAGIYLFRKHRWGGQNG